MEKLVKATIKVTLNNKIVENFNLEITSEELLKVRKESEMKVWDKKDNKILLIFRELYKKYDYQKIIMNIKIEKENYNIYVGEFRYPIFFDKVKREVIKDEEQISNYEKAYYFDFDFF